MTDLELHSGDPVYCLIASPNFNQDGICFAARHSGLIFTSNGGQSWENAFTSLNLTEPLTATAVCLSPDFPTHKHIFAGFPGGILSSEDGGNSWKTADVPTPPPVITVLQTSPNYPQDRSVFAGTLEDGMLLSADMGIHWHPWNFGLLDARVMAVAVSPDFAKDESIFIATETGIFRSFNNGRSWNELNFRPELGPILSLAISPIFSHDGTLFAGTESNGLYITTDEGDTWQRIGEGTIQEVVNAILISPEYPEKPEILILGENKLFESIDRGDNWSERSTTIPEDTALTCVIAPGGFKQGADLLVGTQEGRIFQS